MKLGFLGLSSAQSLEVKGNANVAEHILQFIKHQHRLKVCARTEYDEHVMNS